jgi:beta-glucanase (GH16 family)
VLEWILLRQASSEESFCNEPLGSGHPEFITYTTGSINDYHTYEIKWLPAKVEWFIDGNLVRKNTSHVSLSTFFV